MSRPRAISKNRDPVLLEVKEKAADVAMLPQYPENSHVAVKDVLVTSKANPA